MSFDSSSLYGIQNTSSLVIETIIEYSGSILDLTPPDGYVFYSGSLDFWTGSHQEAPPTPYTGSFTGSYTGSYFGTASLSGSFTGSFYGLVFGSGSFTGSLTGSLTGSVSGSDKMGFITTANQTVLEGEMAWDNGNGTLDIGLKGGNINLAVGQQNFSRVYNAEGTTLNKGEVIYISGSQGNRVAVKRADFLNEAGSSQTLGFVAETITSGAEGFVITNGVLEKINTTGLIEGALLYLSSSGQYSTTKPVAPQHTVILGYVERLHATVGSIYVKIDNGYELGELHNVLTNGVTDGDLLAYSGSVWTHRKQLSGSYGITGSLDITGSLNINGTSYTAATSGTSGTAGTSGATGASGTSGTSGTGFSTINSPSTGRILLSDGTTNSATASNNLSWNSGNETFDITNGGIEQTGPYGSTFAGDVTIGGVLTATSSINMSTGSLINPLIKGYYETMVSKSISADFGGGIVNIDLKAANVHKIKLDGNIMDFNISNNPKALEAGSFTLILEGDGTARSVSWGTEVTWPGGAPSIVSGSGNIDIYAFLSINSGTEYVGLVITQNQSGLI